MENHNYNKYFVPSLIDLPNPENLDRDSLYKKELARLSKSNNLQLRISKMDKETSLKRIYVMGCGRSGTWLLTALISTFRDVCLIPEELAVEYFGLYKTTAPALAMKRYFNSYQTIERIPLEVQIVLIVRHPYDVLTSHNPTTKRQYHISPHRWLGEMLALQYVVDTRRPNTKILRYEDMVTNADGIQAELATFSNLEIHASASEISSTFSASKRAIIAMHGLRQIDQNSLNKFREDKEKIAYLQSIRPRLGRILDWVAQEYGYDVSL